MWRPIREIKYAYQRMIRGFDDSELWSLDTALARHILPRLRAFKAGTCGHPSDLTEQEWDEILDKMINAFDFIANQMWDYPNESVEEHFERERQAYEDVKLFGKWFGALWW